MYIRNSVELVLDCSVHLVTSVLPPSVALVCSPVVLYSGLGRVLVCLLLFTLAANMSYIRTCVCSILHWLANSSVFQDVMTKMSDIDESVRCLDDSFGQRTTFIGHFV